VATDHFQLFLPAQLQGSTAVLMLRCFYSSLAYSSLDMAAAFV